MLPRVFLSIPAVAVALATTFVFPVEAAVPVAGDATVLSAKVPFRVPAGRVAVLERNVDGRWYKITSRRVPLHHNVMRFSVGGTTSPSSFRVVYAKNPTGVRPNEEHRGTGGLFAPVGKKKQVWLSGASGTGVADGSFAAWRGVPVGIGGTWNDSLEAQQFQWSVLPGMEWGGWRKPLDVAVGGIYQEVGESWKRAAKGDYDERWVRMLTTLKTARGDAPTFIRFAHEFNGDWVSWKVSQHDRKNNARQFVRAWKRFRGIQKRVYPSARLVFCPNDGSSSSLGLDWRDAFPGADAVDVMAVDSYNQFPRVTDAGFRRKMMSRDVYGAPLGVEQHRRFAVLVGRPFAVAEWGTSGVDQGSVEFVRLFRGWLGRFAGSSPGGVMYEIVFNVESFPQFQLFPGGGAGSVAYLKQFGKPSSL